MFEATPQRRKLVVIVLLALAAVGGAIRHWAPNPSTLRDMGSLLLVLWVPAIGNVIAFFVRKIKLGRAGGFPADRPFRGHLRVELTPLDAQPAPLQGDFCALVVGTEGFSVRLSQPLAAMAGGPPLTADAEFLNPALALPRFGGDTAFRVVAHNRLVGQGRVLRILAEH